MLFLLHWTVEPVAETEKALQLQVGTLQETPASLPSPVYKQPPPSHPALSLSHPQPQAPSVAVTPIWTCSTAAPHAPVYATRLPLKQTNLFFMRRNTTENEQNLHGNARVLSMVVQPHVHWSYIEWLTPDSLCSTPSLSTVDKQCQMHTTAAFGRNLQRLCMNFISCKNFTVRFVRSSKNREGVSRVP